MKKHLDDIPINFGYTSEDYRKMTGSQRLEIACEMTRRAKEIWRERLRNRHPDASALELKLMEICVILREGDLEARIARGEFRGKKIPTLDDPTQAE